MFNGALERLDVAYGAWSRSMRTSRTTSCERHGLGLAIVKAVAEMHGGTVFATSKDGINTFGFSVAATRADQAS